MDEFLQLNMKTMLSAEHCNVDLEIPTEKYVSTHYMTETENLFIRFLFF